MIRSIFSIALVALAVSPAHAVDLTGVWEGTVTCQVFNGAYSKTKNADSTLLIAQEGTTFSARLDDELSFNGAVIDSTAKPTEQGEAAMNTCSTDATPLGDGDDEIARLKVKVNPEKGTGSLTGESHFATTGTVLSCKYKLKRTSTMPPKFTGCPA
jgi:hypothetical protein